jgi:hypothetical protein
MLLIISISSGITKGYLKKWGHERQFHDKGRAMVINDSYDCIKEIDIYQNQQYFLEKYKFYNDNSAEKISNVLSNQSTPRLLIDLLVMLCIVFCVNYYYKYEFDKIQYLIFLGFSAYRLLPSINRIISSLQSLDYSLPIIKNIVDNNKIW